MSELRTEFERLHPVPDCLRYVQSVNDYRLHIITQNGNGIAFAYNTLWQGFQSGHAVGLEQQAKRIAELESSLADAIEAQQILGLKLAHAEAGPSWTFNVFEGAPPEGSASWMEFLTNSHQSKNYSGLVLRSQRLQEQSHSSTALGEPPSDIPERS